MESHGCEMIPPQPHAGLALLELAPLEDLKMDNILVGPVLEKGLDYLPVRNRVLYCTY